MKRTLISSLLWVGMAIATHAQQRVQVGDLYYELSGNEAIVTFMYWNNFHNYEGLSGMITIPPIIIYEEQEYAVTSIGDWAFQYCSSLTSVTIPEDVTSIGDGAFNNCTGLTSVTIPDGVTNIGNGAFQYCRNLTSVTIPEGVTSIEYCAFEGCSDLTSATIPESVTSIGESAFQDCSSLKSVTIPESVTSIGYSAFKGCSSLTSVTIPESVTSIREMAFSYCRSLTSVTIPESVTSIEELAFSYSGLTSITIPECVTSIGNDAFSYCKELTTVTISATIPSIESNAFGGCDKLNAVYYEGDLAEWCHISFADGRANPLCNGADLYIGDVTVTPELVIPEGLGTIGDYAFYGSHLLSFTLPTDLEQIGGIGIIDNTELKTMTCYADYPPTCTEATFSGVDKSVLLYVPEVGLDDYLRHPVWSSFYNIRPFKNNGLATPALTEAITVVNDEVHLNLPGTFEVHVYDLQGHCVLRTTESRFALPQDVYIIKVGNEAVKVAI